MSNEALQRVEMSMSAAPFVPGHFDILCLFLVAQLMAQLQTVSTKGHLSKSSRKTMPRSRDEHISRDGSETPRSREIRPHSTTIPLTRTAGPPT